MIYDEAISRHLSCRLKYDHEAVKIISEAIVNPITSDVEAAELSSLLSVSVPLANDVIKNLNHRLESQIHVAFALIAHDRVMSATLPVKNLLIRVIEASRK